MIYIDTAGIMAATSKYHSMSSWVVARPITPAPRVTPFAPAARVFGSSASGSSP
jgi:hypothetical protein